MDDFDLSCKSLYRALTIREKYMKLAYQRFPRTAAQFLRDIEGETFKPEDQLQPGMMKNEMQKRRFVELGFTYVTCKLGAKRQIDSFVKNCHK